MAFRKTLRSSYYPPTFSGGFGEVKFSPSASSDSSQFVSRKFESIEKLSESTLPLVSLDTVVKSGQVINGSVSFAPSDPAIIESTVHSGVAEYIESNQSTNSVTPPAHED